MFPRGSRRSALVAVLLLAPVLIAAAAVVLPAHGHECAFDKGCLTCRWAADAVAEVGAPAPVPAPPQPAGEPFAASASGTSESSPRPAASRGPPSA
jgi:hypothetical protein